MSDSKKKPTEDELRLVEETERFMEEVNSNPEVAEFTAPAEMKEKLFAEIKARNEAKQKAEEEAELIRLGKLYKKKRKARKYWILAAAIICALAFGITSVGGPKRIFERLEYALSDRDRVHVDSDNENVEPIADMDEEKAYQEIDDKYGFYPVTFHYLPKGVELLDAEIFDNIQRAMFVYGQEDKVKINYFIRTNYRESSWVMDAEDELLEDFTEKNEFTVIYIRRYRVNSEEERWSLQFEYKDVSYYVVIYDTTESEVRKIVKHLYFS